MGAEDVDVVRVSFINSHVWLRLSSQVKIRGSTIRGSEIAVKTLLNLLCSANVVGMMLTHSFEVTLVTCCLSLWQVKDASLSLGEVGLLMLTQDLILLMPSLSIGLFTPLFFCTELDELIFVSEANTVYVAPNASLFTTSSSGFSILIGDSCPSENQNGSDVPLRIRGVVLLTVKSYNEPKLKLGYHN